MPIDKSKYPANWYDIAYKCKEAAGWKCEECGTSHMSDGSIGSCMTVHHPNCDTLNPDAVLIVLCARCHLKADRKIRKEEKNKNQINLFKDL